MSDTWTVFQKEVKELILMREGLRRGGFAILVFVAVFGIFLPLQMGRDWIENPTTLLLWAWAPLFLVTGVIADAFAGERERHTLETLLATRLSDRSILVGKVLAAIAYGWGQALLSLVLGVITVNLAVRSGQFLFYSPLALAGILILSFLGGGLAAGAGILVSLRAATVRQAQQTLSIAVMIIFFGLIYGIRALPVSWQSALTRLLPGNGMTGPIVGTVVILFVLDAGLLLAALARFQRARLILD
jgi:ABC-2 type transport system permease protein